MISSIEPKEVWSQFAALNAIPRPSKREERVAQFMTDFGKKLGLEVIHDAFGNVIIKKPATKGKEKSPTIIMQGHLDMVHQKNNGTEFDFETQGIKMLIDGDWVKADGTTLGADNGLGVAAIMAILASKDMAHPAIEALFTLDEEAGMGGAKNLGKGLLKGKLMLNLDTEEDHVFTIGCAGGIDTLVDWSYTEEATPADAAAFTLTLNGMRGGHSGMEINVGRGNANKLMARLLMDLQKTGVRVSSWHAGSARNAIPRESNVILVTTKPASLEKALKKIAKEIKTEFATPEPGLDITLTPVATPAKVMSRSAQKKFLMAVRSAHNGVYRMSPEVVGLVEASSNLAIVKLEGGHLHIGSLQRSSVESSKADVAAAFRAPFDLIGAKISHDNIYPGWKPNPSSKLVQKMGGVYKQMFGTEAHVEACHAGLECGIISEHYPGLDMISFGPTILNAHSPGECASISSTAKFWSFLTATLAEL
jgi:dipeptidase D